jgi:hypothetical protein
MIKYVKCGEQIINSKKRVIFKLSGSSKRYVKYQGNYIPLSTYRKMISTQKGGNDNERPYKNNDLVLLYDIQKEGYLTADTSDSATLYEWNVDDMISQMNIVISKKPTIFSIWKCHEDTFRGELCYSFTILYSINKEFKYLNYGGIWCRDKYGKEYKDMRYCLTEDYVIYRKDEQNRIRIFSSPTSFIRVEPNRISYPSIQQLRATEEGDKMLLKTLQNKSKSKTQNTFI